MILSMLLFISVTAVLFIQYNSSQILGSYTDIEEMNMGSSLHSLEDSFILRAQILEKTTQDYAQWDDTARYVQTHDISFESENLNLKTLKNLGITFVAVIDPAGTVSYLKWYEPESYEEIPIFDVSRTVSVLQMGDARNRSSILQSADGDLLLISQVVITPSYGDGPSVGVLTFGIPLQPIIDDTIRKTNLSKSSVQTLPRDEQENPFQMFRIVTDGVRTVTILNETLISGKISYPGSSFSKNLTVTIVGEKRIYGHGKSFVSSYFFNSVVYSFIVLTVGVLLMIGLIRKYDHAQSLMGRQEQEIVHLRERREILDKFHVILDRYLHSGPDTDQNIALISSAAGNLLNAEYVVYLRIEDGGSVVVGSWPQSDLRIHTWIANLASSHHPYEGIAENKVIPIHQLCTEDVSLFTEVYPSIRFMLFRSIRPGDDILGYFVLFLQSDGDIDETNQIVLDLLVNVLYGEESRRDAKVSLYKRDVVLEAIVYSATQLLVDLSVSSIVEILHTFVTHIGVHEAHLFIWKTDNDGMQQLTHDYVWDEDTSRFSSSQIKWDDLQKSPIKSWLSLNSAPVIRAGTPGMFPEEKEYLESKDIHSIVLIPLLSRNKYVGALFLVDRVRNRVWLPNELDALKIASGLIMATIAKIESDEDIREREENFKLFFNHIRDFIFVLDSEGRIITANLFALQEIGIKSSDLKGMHLSGIFSTRWKDTPSISGEGLTLRGSPEKTAVLLTIEGKEIPVELRQLPGIWNGNPAVFCICKDISGLKRSEHKFATAFRSSQVLHAIWNLTTDRLIDANTTFCNSLGFSKNDLIHLPENPLTQIFEPTQIQKTKEVILTHGSIQDYEITIRTREGEVRHGSLYGALIEIDGEPCVLYSIVDITDRKIAEIRIQTLLTDLSDSNRDLYNFAHVVAHDLKDPLRGIFSLVSWISEDYHERIGPDGQKYLQMISDQVQRMSALIDGILAYSQVGLVREERALVRIESVVYDVLNTLSPPPSVTIRVEAGLPDLLGEKTKIQQVFQNIISNSLAHLGHDDGVIVIRAQPYGKTWLFEISDNGPGIDPSLHASIFEVFRSFSQSKDKKGTGIGLSIVKRIVDTSGGSVWVESVPGAGATFFFTFASPGEYTGTVQSGDRPHDSDTLYRR